MNINGFFDKIMPDSLLTSKDNIILFFSTENEPIDYLKSFLLFLVIFLLIQLFRWILKTWVEKITLKTKTKIDDFIVHILDKERRIYFLFLSFFLAIKTLNIPSNLTSFIDKTFLILSAIEISKILVEIVEFIFKRYVNTRKKAKKAAYYAIITISKVIVWFTLIMFIISNFGVNITSLVTGFGIIGIIVAFSFQSILKDLFSYLTILLDRPIDVGDYIKINDKSGTVKKIGIKTTRIDSVDGEEIVIPNAMITESNINNYGKANFRRVRMKIPVSFNTDVEKIEEIKQKIKDIIEEFPNNEFERCTMKTIGEYGYIFDIVYKIIPRDYSLYIKTNESVNLKIIKYFNSQKIVIPYPTKIVINKEYNEKSVENK